MKKQKSRFASAVIVAAGKGTRMNLDVSKQYIEIRDIPILARTLSVFEDCHAIGEIVLVVNEADIIHCKQEIVDRYGFEKVKAIVAGGRERQQSVYNGLREVDGCADIVVIHDGVRPFISEERIEDSIEGAAEWGAACVAVPVKDTIKIVDSDNYIEGTPDRGKLWAIQTPQAFKYDIIIDAHERAMEGNYSGTDDAVLVERTGKRVRLVMGSYMNIKITTQEDLILAEAIVDQQEMT